MTILEKFTFVSFPDMGRIGEKPNCKYGQNLKTPKV